MPINERVPTSKNSTSLGRAWQPTLQTSNQPEYESVRPTNTTVLWRQDQAEKDVWSFLTTDRLTNICFHVSKIFFASFGILIIWGTPITNISMRLPPQIPCQTHLPAARGPGICSPSDCHLQTLGSLCHPPACSWASTCGQRRAVPDMWTRSLGVKPTQLNKRSSALSDHQRESRFHPAFRPRATI